MEEKETEQMREYLRIKKLEEEDKSDELIDEVYNNCKIDENTIKTLKEQNIVMAEKALRVLACRIF